MESFLDANNLPNYKRRNQGAGEQSRCCFSHGCKPEHFLKPVLSPRMDTPSRGPETLAACPGVKIRPSSSPCAPLFLQLSCGIQLRVREELPTLLGRAQLGAEGRGPPQAQVQALGPVFRFISLHSLGRSNVIASPLGNTAFLCHGNVYPVQTGEFLALGLE